MFLLNVQEIKGVWLLRKRYIGITLTLCVRINVRAQTLQLLVHYVADLVKLSCILQNILGFQFSSYYLK